MPHQRLIAKVEAHGISGKISQWINAWLDNREQRVVLNGNFSSWRKVVSGVPQGSVLGPTLFLIYINDLDEKLSSNVLKFADDTKLIHQIKSPQDMHTLQTDLDTLTDWANEWQMCFNVDKCKVMHFGRTSPQYTYLMNQAVLQVTDCEKDLGVEIQSSLRQRFHIADKVKKANQILGMIRRTFSCRSQEILLPLYKSLVRPHLDYASPVWSPYHKEDIVLLEKVQRRFTRMISGLASKTYEERLSTLKLNTLETRRIRADLLEVFKMFHGHSRVDLQSLFVMDVSVRRGHKFKLYKRRFRMDLRKHFFSQRVVNIWNSLPDRVVAAPSINTFKTYLGIYLAENRGL